jgi:hypothetical protein
VIAAGMISWAALVVASLWLARAAYKHGYDVGERIGTAQGYLNGRRSEREEGAE